MTNLVLPPRGTARRYTTDQLVAAIRAVLADVDDTTRHRIVAKLGLGKTAATTDVLLDPPSAAETAEWARRTAALGKVEPSRVWTGVFEPLLRAVDAASRSDVLEKMRALRDAQTDPNSPSNVITDGATTAARTRATIRELNRQAAEFWGPK